MDAQDARDRGFDTTSCSFPFHEIGDGFRTRTVFVDENGTPTRIRTHVNVDGIAVNEATGKTAQLQENLVIDTCPIRKAAGHERVWTSERRSRRRAR